MKHRVALFVGALLVILAATSPAADRTPKLPLGLQEQAVFIAPDNPLTLEKVALGKQFFWDKRWSKSRTVACVSCHQPDQGWTDAQRFSMNFGGKLTPRRAPTLVNRLFSDRQLWTGIRATLEEQARKDSNVSDETVVVHLSAIPSYQEQHRKVFGHDLDAEGVSRAVAAYVRAIVSGNSPYDRFQAGDKSALSAVAQRGLTLFEGKAACVRCHAGFNFTDENYRNIGIGMIKESPDLGRFNVTKLDADKGAFKTPTLRDVAKRPMYMHDGSLQTLADVVAWYNKGGLKNPWLSADIRPLGLTAEEQVALVEFMKALTGEIDPEVSRPPTLPN